MKITFLGTGSSLGIPVIGCPCGVCTSDNSRNRRDRPSILVEYNERRILIDTSPDFRQQALSAGLSGLDAVIYTHAHADHIFGLDDLRILVERERSPLPVYASRETLTRLQNIFGYAFSATIWHTDQPRLKPLEINGPFELFGETVQPIPVMHQNTEVFGYRFGDFAYLTDVSHIPESSMTLLRGVDTLVISALRRKPHPKHIALDGIIDTVESLGVSKAWLTHISHDLEHDWLNQYCPGHIEPAYDGLVITV